MKPLSGHSVLAEPAPAAPHRAAPRGRRQEALAGPPPAAGGTSSALRRGLLSVLWNGPLCAVLLLCCALPLGWMALQIASHPEAVTELHMGSFRWALLSRTLRYNALAGIVATLLALPAALVLGRGRGRIAAAMWFVLPVSLLVPSLTYAYGWSQFLRLCGIRPEMAGTGDTFRCIWSLATWLWALPAGLIGLALRRGGAPPPREAPPRGAPRGLTRRPAGPPDLTTGG